MSHLATQPYRIQWGVAWQFQQKLFISLNRIKNNSVKMRRTLRALFSKLE